MADKVLRLPIRSARASVRPEPLWREAVGEQLRAERVARELRIVDVAERAGVAPQYLSEIERGRKDASSEVLSAVSGALGLTVHEIARRASVRLVGSLDRVTNRNRSGGPVCLAA
jgi:transcriptional regulator with XRE-family HTH domain